MEKMTSEQMAQAMDMMIRMQCMDSIDTSLKTIVDAHHSLDYRNMDIDRFKAISDAFENLAKTMGETL